MPRVPARSRPEAAITAADHDGEAAAQSLSRMEALAREHVLRVVGGEAAMRYRVISPAVAARSRG